MLWKVKLSGRCGVTIIELICVVAIMLIIASVAMPVGRNIIKKQKEIELRRALREIRMAIDEFHELASRFPGVRQQLDADNEDLYPPDLETLVEGIDLGLAVERKAKFLRRIPVDPMTGTTEWGFRSSRDEPDSEFWGGENIFDIYTKSNDTALDGTKYKDW
ncbi:MAG: type II secretion system protein [Acidobacteriota bacterium]